MEVRAASRWRKVFVIVKSPNGSRKKVLDLLVRRTDSICDYPGDPPKDISMRCIIIYWDKGSSHGGQSSLTIQIQTGNLRPIELIQYPRDIADHIFIFDFQRQC